METVFWVIVAIVVLAVVYTCVLTPMKTQRGGSTQTQRVRYK
jgi:hypothetical protein